MNHSTAEGFIRLFGLYLLVSSIIGLASVTARHFLGTSMLGFVPQSFESQVSGILAWGMLQVAISFVAGVVVLMKSNALAQIVVPGEG